MHVIKTKLDGVLQIQLDVFEDHRGTYIETYNENLYRQHGIDLKFVQDDISVSYKSVLRGIHGDMVTWKLISCLYGRFYFVVVNCNEESLQFGQWLSFTLSDQNHTQILVPPKYGNAHLVLSDKTIFHYKQNTYYKPDLQVTYKWDDPLFNIWWPIKNPILSERDEQGHLIK